MKMKLTTALLLTASLFATSCATAPKPETASPASEQAYPSVTLLSWSDFHSSIYEAVKDDSALGGLPVFMAAVEGAKSDGLNLLIDGGDMFQGAMPFNEAKGMGMVEVMNTLGIDAASLGNHEFDYGPGANNPSERGALQEVIEASQFPWVTANVVATQDNQIDQWPYPNLVPYTFIQKGPYKIAIIGLLSQETPIATLASHVVGLDFQSPAKTLEKYIPEVVAQNPDMIIVNAHITGLPDVEYQPGEKLTDVPFDGEVAEILALPEDIRKHIDLLLTGHSHKSVIAIENGLPVIQSYSAGREITVMTLQGDANGLHVVTDSIHKISTKHTPIDVACGQEKPAEYAPIAFNDGQITPSKAGLDIVDKYEARMTENRCDVIGCFHEYIERTSEKESALGNLISDALRQHFPEAEASFTNAGGIRIDMPKGPAYRETINALMPFENYAHFVEVTGEDILRVLKLSSSGKHGLTQVSGIQYQVEAGCTNPHDINGDGNIEKWENNCLCEGPLINGKPIDPTKTYKIAISDFLLNGGDDHAGCLNSAKLIEKGPLIKKTIVNFVQKQQSCLTEQVLISPESPRITLGSCNGKFVK